MYTDTTTTRTSEKRSVAIEIAAPSRTSTARCVHSVTSFAPNSSSQFWRLSSIWIRSRPWSSSQPWKRSMSFSAPVLAGPSVLARNVGVNPVHRCGGPVDENRSEGDDADCDDSREPQVHERDREAAGDADPPAPLDPPHERVEQQRDEAGDKEDENRVTHRAGHRPARGAAGAAAPPAGSTAGSGSAHAAASRRAYRGRRRAPPRGVGVVVLGGREPGARPSRTLGRCPLALSEKPVTIPRPVAQLNLVKASDTVRRMPSPSGPGTPFACPQAPPEDRRPRPPAGAAHAAARGHGRDAAADRLRLGGAGAGLVHRRVRARGPRALDAAPAGRGPGRRAPDRPPRRAAAADRARVLRRRERRARARAARAPGEPRPPREALRPHPRPHRRRARLVPAPRRARHVHLRARRSGPRPARTCSRRSTGRSSGSPTTSSTAEARRARRHPAGRRAVARRLRDAPRGRPGARRSASAVAAASSKLGRVVDLSKVERQALASYTQDAGNHVLSRSGPRRR